MPIVLVHEDGAAVDPTPRDNGSGYPSVVHADGGAVPQPPSESTSDATSHSQGTIERNPKLDPKGTTEAP